MLPGTSERACKKNGASVPAVVEPFAASATDGGPVTAVSSFMARADNRVGWRQPPGFAPMENARRCMRAGVRAVGSGMRMPVGLAKKVVAPLFLLQRK